MVNRIYPSKLQFNVANVSDAEASFLDLHLSISDDFVQSKIYDKPDDFDFDSVNFPFPDDVPNTRNKVLTAELLRLGYRYHKLCKALSKFYRRHFDIMSD